MTEERRVQLVAEVDTTRTRAGFNEIGQQANTMAQQVAQAGDRAERAVNSVGTGASTASRNVDAAQRNIIAAIQRTTTAMEAGGRQTAMYYELLARQRGIDPASLSPYLSALRSVEQAQARTGASAAQVANAMRMVPAQLTDVATQLAGGQSPLLVLLQQGGQLRDSFGSIPAMIRGVGSSLLGMVNPLAVAAAGLGAVAYAYNEGSKEADAYNRSIIMSGNAAGTSRNQLADYAALISKTVGTQAEAAQALAALTATGQVGSANLKQFGQVAVQVQKYIGRSVDETVKDFAELGKSPVEASLKLSESYHYLTSATYEQVKALQDQGKMEEAAEVAQKAYADAFADRAARMKENLGVIQRAWIGTKESAASAWDVFLGVGRKKTSSQELAEVQEQIKLARMPVGIGGGDRSDAAEMRRAAAASKLTELLRRESELQAKVAKEARDAQDAADKEKLRQAGLVWDQIMDGTLSRAQLKQKEIAKVLNAAKEAAAPKDQVNAALRKIDEKYASLDNPALAALEGEGRRQKEILAGQLNELESNYKQRLVSESDYIERKRDLQLQENKLEIDLAQKRAQIDSGKEDKSAYKKDLADLAVLAQQRLNIANSATSALANANASRRLALDNLVAGWDRAIEAETDAITQEVSLFGQSDQARTVAIAQIKLETDARKLIADQAKEGHALSEQEVADLNVKTEARKRYLAAAMNQKAAIAGAQQLLELNRKFSVEYIADADERARRTLAIDARQWQDRIAKAEAGSEARQKLVEQFDVWMANRQMQPVLDRWKGVVDNLDNNFQEGFRNMLTGGQNAWSSFAKSISNTLKTSLADALYQVFVKKYVVQVVTALAGAISGPAAAAALNGNAVGAVSGASSAIGAAQAASSLYSAVTGGFNTLTSGVSDAIQAGLYKTGLSQNIASNGQFAQYAGQAAGMLGSYALGSGINSLISGGFQVGGGFQTAEKISTAVASYFGPIAGSVAGAISGFINRAFGLGGVIDQGLRGTLSADSLIGESYSTRKGGWFRSDKTDTKEFTDAMVAQFTSGLKSLEVASSGFAEALGVSSDAIKGYSKQFDIKLTGDATKDQQAVADLFQGISDEIAKKLVPDLGTFAKTGEKASDTLERLAGDFKGTDQVAQMLGFTAKTLFGAVGLESGNAREQLIGFAGGLSTLSQQASTFSQNFLTPAQRLAPVADALDKALSSLGLDTIPTTRDQFKSLVDSMVKSGSAATEAGAKQLASLLALADTFAKVHPDETSDLLQLQAQAYELLDDKIGKATILQQQHALALESMTPAMAAATQKLWGLQAAAEAIDKVKSDGSALLNNVDNAFSVLQGVVGREKDILQKRIDKETEAVNRLKGLTDAIGSTLDSFKVPGTEAAVRQFAQAQIKASLAVVRAGGALSDDQITSLKKAFGTVTGDASAQFGSYQDYLRDMLQTQNDIAELGKLTGGQLNAQETQLDIDKKQLTSLDAMLANAQEQVNVLKGISTTGLSIQQALQGLGTAIVSAKGNASVAGVSAISQAYQSVLGRAPDSAGLDFWQNKAASGVPIDAIKDAISSSDEARLQALYKSTFGRTADAAGLDYWLNQLKKGVSWADVGKAFSGSAEAKLHPFAVGTNSVPEDMPAFIHKGERIIPAADNRALMARLASPQGDVSALVAEVQELRKTVARQQAALDRIANNTREHKEMFDQATGGGGPLLVEMA